MVLTSPSSRYINRATSTRVKSLTTCRFAHPPGFSPSRADETFEGPDHLFAGLDNVADEGNIPTKRSTTNILDQNLPAPTAKLTVNDFGNVTDVVAWMNKHKQCLICGKSCTTPSRLVKHLGAHKMVVGISFKELRAAAERTVKRIIK
jgi:hypothetical protein